MFLQNCKAGDTMSVDTVCLNPALTRRLHILGLTGGTKISVLRKKRCGTMIITVRGVRYAIGKAVSEGIIVREANDE